MGYRLNLKREYEDDDYSNDNFIGLSYDNLPVDILLNEKFCPRRNDLESRCKSREDYRGCQYCECWQFDWYKITWEALWKYCDLETLKKNQNIISSFCPSGDYCEEEKYCCDCKELKYNHYDYIWANIS